MRACFKIILPSLWLADLAGHAAEPLDHYVLVDQIPERIMRLELSPVVEQQALIKQYWGDISLLDMRTGHVIWRYKQHDLSFSDYGMAWSASGRRIVVRSQEPVILDGATGVELFKLEMVADDDHFESFAFSADDIHVAGAGRPGQDIRIWDARSGKLVSSLPGVTLGRTLAFQGASRLQFTRDGKALFAAGGEWIGVWDIATETLLRSFDLYKILNLDERFSYAGGWYSFSADLRFVAFNIGSTLYLMSLESGRMIRTYELDAFPRSYEFSDDMTTLEVVALGTRAYEPDFPLEPYQFRFFEIDVLSTEVRRQKISVPFHFLPNQHQTRTNAFRVAAIDFRTGIFVLAAGRDPQFKPPTGTSFERFLTHQILAWKFL